MKVNGYYYVQELNKENAKKYYTQIVNKSVGRINFIYEEEEHNEKNI